ncbi:MULTISPECIES: PA2169 family four-helix-bundle protein [Lysobacter]|uniref:Uncharacterized protein n=2 Tax=Lysobacter TaxID=68 RepID=A0A0S2DH41_LYSEN|nr:MULTISPECIES: PA2169 family four-helix-bundle protein [Lysobacter]ALN57762.1 hypothetical protein GLE_2413 [Lysobacter enzymogenes]QCW26295.1 PA2169 family four-helix-bundle protein [Lysobacter enzymogenes]QQP99117.1 PA2169 family four-helix-bundle protein [Lysobacter enzymogenes]UZW58563.1 PA2169 family four-helix-bundle protein [Lysobacter enzymogenes]WMT02275.1 PA2169 family four-helix-bundle protein [Lysobacter yananisis]
MTDKKTEHSLNDLIQIARDGEHFYAEAAKKVGDTELAGTFLRMSTAKGAIVSQLSAEVAAGGGKPAESGTFVGTMQEVYGRVRAALGDTRYGYVAELEESEDRLLKAFNEVQGDPNVAPSARAAVERLMPQVRESHREMSQRKHAMKH